MAEYRFPAQLELGAESRNVAVTIIFPTHTDEQLKQIHGGTYWPAELLSRGEIDQETCRTMIEAARVRRNLWRSRERQARRRRG